MNFFSLNFPIPIWILLSVEIIFWWVLAQHALHISSFHPQTLTYSTPWPEPGLMFVHRLEIVDVNHAEAPNDAHDVIFQPKSHHTASTKFSSKLMEVSPEPRRTSGEPSKNLISNSSGIWAHGGVQGVGEKAVERRMRRNSMNTSCGLKSRHLGQLIFICYLPSHSTN